VKLTKQVVNCPTIFFSSQSTRYVKKLIRR